LRQLKYLRECVVQGAPVTAAECAQSSIVHMIAGGQTKKRQILHQTPLYLARAGDAMRVGIGADPARLDHFTKMFAPLVIDLSNDNHRSGGTEIAIFANDMLAGRLRREPYSGIGVSYYPGNKNQAFTALLVATYSARRRLVDSGKKDWSLAVLVPTKKMTLQVSDVFRDPPANMTEVHHTAVLEMEGIIHTLVWSYTLRIREQSLSTYGHCS
jgi:DNA helicase-2/ATP-dependent DNA helicase PcrA